MKGKEEDDDGKPKSASESMQINQLVDSLVHVELEQMPNCSRFQPNPVKEGGMFDGVCCPTILYMIRSFSERYYWWFYDFYVHFLMTIMITR